MRRRRAAPQRHHPSPRARPRTDPLRLPNVRRGIVVTIKQGIELGAIQDLVEKLRSSDIVEHVQLYAEIIQ